MSSIGGKSDMDTSGSTIEGEVRKSGTLGSSPVVMRFAVNQKVRLICSERKPVGTVAMWSAGEYLVDFRGVRLWCSEEELAEYERK